MTTLPPTVYHLVLQDGGRDNRPICDIESGTPFPRIEPGDNIVVEETTPQTWDVISSLLVVRRSPDGVLHVRTCLIVDSPCDRPDGPR